jgi:hypothetical protein
LTPSILEHELQRERWHRTPQPLTLIDAGSKDFAIHGLAVPLTDPRLRLVILTADPRHEFIEFDRNFWEWWSKGWFDPATNRSIDWRNRRSSANGACLGTGPEENWQSYVALLRSGGLDFTVGKDVTCGLPNAGGLRLLNIIGRVWTMFHRYGDIVQRFHFGGPWEMSLGIRDTYDTLLGHVAEGWAEPRGKQSGPPCLNSSLLHHREIWEAWSDEMWARDQAFSIGSWLEDAWGCPDRRFIAREGKHTGQFDATTYGVG